MSRMVIMVGFDKAYQSFDQCWSLINAPGLCLQRLDGTHECATAFGMSYAFALVELFDAYNGCAQHTLLQQIYRFSAHVFRCLMPRMISGLKCGLRSQALWISCSMAFASSPVSSLPLPQL